MANYREIVTKAVIAKGKKTFTTDNSITVENNPSTVLGCWVINHNFNGVRNNDKININGSYDVNIWYSYDNDTKTGVVKQTNNYNEVVNMREPDEDLTNEEIIVRSLKQPSCTDVSIEGNTINYNIEKELGIELVGDIKVKIEANMEEDPWHEIVEENKEEVIDKIDEVDVIKKRLTQTDISYIILCSCKKWRDIMAVKLRLKRMGAKKKPTYRIVATDSRRPRDGKYIELIGTYAPLNEDSVKINEEVALKWLNNGAIPTDTVKNLFSKAGIIKKYTESKNNKDK